MALLVQTWDIPAGRDGREEYALIGQEAISTVLAQPGVLEFRAYRNPLRASPQVAHAYLGGEPALREARS